MSDAFVPGQPTRIRQLEDVLAAARFWYEPGTGQWRRGDIVVTDEELAKLRGQKDLPEAIEALRRRIG